MRGLIGPFQVEQARVRHPSGEIAAVLRCGELDIDTLDPARRATAAAAFARLCQTIETPLQMVVRVRPIPAPEADEPLSPLDAAMLAHRAAHITSASPHSRELLLVTSASSERGLTVAVQRMAEAVRAIGVSAERVQGRDLRALLWDLDTPVAWASEPHSARVHDTLVRGYSLSRLPAQTVDPGWLRPLLTVSAECDIAIHLIPAALDAALTTLRRRLRDLSSHRMLEAERGVVGDVHVDIGLDAASALRDRLARNHARPLLLSVTAVVRARSYDALNAAGERVRHAFQATLCGVETAHFRHVPAYITGLPLAVDALHSRKLVDSGSAATCLPWVDAGCDDPGGYRIGHATRTQAPIALAPFQTTLHRNANIALLAASGHGKSFVLGTLVLEAALHGVESVIIDPEGEHRGAVDAAHGTYLNLAPGTDCAVNVFDTTGSNIDACVTGVTELAGVLCGGLADLDRAHVDAAARDAIRVAAARKRQALLEDCLPSLERSAPGVAVVLRRFCGGSLGALFNRPTTARIGCGVTGISLRDMPAEHIAAATLIVARWLWTLVQRQPRRRHIVFDEVGALCAHPALRALLVQLARRCRKYSASLVVATQNAQDLLGTDEGSVVVSNCALALLGGQRHSETARMQHAFGLTDRQRRFLETASRGEFLLLAGDRRVEVRIDVPTAYVEVLSKRSTHPDV